jgi:anti-anti-sigma regulatory factor
MMNLTIMKHRHYQESIFSMPIHAMSFDEGVFFTKQVGYIDHVDASTWVDALSTCAQKSEGPVIAVVEMLEVDRISPTITDVCAIVLDNTNVLGIAVVTSVSMTPRNAPVLDELKALAGVRLFSTEDKALSYARAQLHPSIVPYSNSNLISTVIHSAF